jgi:hypothetical protein
MLEGRKTIESRFSKHKTAPYNQITKDDIIIVKETSGQVIAFMEIQDVIFIDLKDTNTNDIKEKYQDDLCVDDDFWKAKKDSKYVTLIFIKKISLIEPFSITKKGMQSWIVLNNPL